MDSKWRVLDLTAFEGFVSYERGRLKVGERSAPLAEVDFILLGPGCSWGYGLVGGLERFDVAAAICDWKNTPISTLYHWSSNTKVFTRHEAQAQLTLPRSKNAWKQIIKAKLRGQANALDAMGRPNAEQLRAFARAVKSGDPNNLEGQGARLYWSSYMPEGGFRRNQVGDDTVNGMLNYGYTILRGRVLTRVIAAGLSPTLSLFHRNRSNGFALVDDLMEPFRPAVDYAVYKLLLGGATELGRPEKAALVGVLAEKISEDQDFTVRSVIEDFCIEFALYVEGKRERLSVPTWECVMNGDGAKKEGERGG